MNDKTISGTVEKALTLLSYLSEGGSEGVTLGELSEHASLAKPTTHRLLTTLVRQAFAERVPNSRRYRIGPAITAIARRNGAADSQSQRWRICLDKIASMTKAAALMLIRSGDEALCVEASFGEFMVPTLTAGVGGRIPLGLGPGSLIILASLEDAEVADILQRNAPRLLLTKTRTLEALMERVKRARKRRFSYDGGEVLPEVSGLAIALERHGVIMPMTLTLASLSSRLPASEVDVTVELLRGISESMLDT